jgi:hypothetical protein
MIIATLSFLTGLLENHFAIVGWEEPAQVLGILWCSTIHDRHHNGLISANSKILLLCSQSAYFLL